MAVVPVRGVVFDLDGVIVSTDELHFEAWRSIADELGIPFGHADNDRLRGVSRMESLRLVLGEGAAALSLHELEALAARKNDRYVGLLASLSPSAVLPGVLKILGDLRERGIRLAIGSSSRNAGAILRAVHLSDAFDAVVDGSRISRSKPDPEVFLLAARELALPPGECLVVEDAIAGVAAASAAGMRVVAVGSAAGDPSAVLSVRGLDEVTAEQLLGLGPS